MKCAHPHTSTSTNPSRRDRRTDNTVDKCWTHSMEPPLDTSSPHLIVGCTMWDQLTGVDYYQRSLPIRMDESDVAHTRTYQTPNDSRHDRQILQKCARVTLTHIPYPYASWQPLDFYDYTYVQTWSNSKSWRRRSQTPNTFVFSRSTYFGLVWNIVSTFKECGLWWIWKTTIDTLHSSWRTHWRRVHHCKPHDCTNTAICAHIYVN